MFNFLFSFYVCVISGGAGAHLGFICCWRCGAPLLDLLRDKTLYFQASGSTRLWLKMREGLFFLFFSLHAQIIATSWEYHSLAEIIPFSSWSLISCFVSLTFSAGQIKVPCIFFLPEQAAWWLWVWISSSWGSILLHCVLSFSVNEVWHPWDSIPSSFSVTANKQAMPHPKCPPRTLPVPSRPPTSPAAGSLWGTWGSPVAMRRCWIAWCGAPAVMDVPVLAITCC